MLKLERIINKGARRLCLYHPEDPTKCVKVAMNHRHNYQLQNELDAYKKTRHLLAEFLPAYEENLVETNLGPGLVCDLICDDDGEPSRWLHNYMQERKVNDNIMEQMYRFADIVRTNIIPFYDPNTCNFLVQQKDGKERVVFTDMKSYNDYKPWIYLRLEKVIPAITRRIIDRRMDVLFRKLKDTYQR